MEELEKPLEGDWKGKCCGSFSALNAIAMGLSLLVPDPKEDPKTVCKVMQRHDNSAVREFGYRMEAALLRAEKEQQEATDEA